MSPSGGRMTTVDPSMMWSPEKSIRSCSSRKHRWFDAWPGVWMARSTNSVASMRSPSPSGRSISRPSRASNASTSAPVRSLRPADAGGVVGVGVGADDPADAVAAAAGDGVEVRLVVGTGVDHRRSRRCRPGRCSCRAGHHPRVVGHDAAHQRAERARHAVHDRLRLRDVVRIVGCAHAGPRSAPAVARSCGGEQLVAGGVPPDDLQAHDGGVDHGEVAGAMAVERVNRAHPLAADELAVVVGVGLPLRRPREEEPGVEALGLALGGDPVARSSAPRRRRAPAPRLGGRRAATACRRAAAWRCSSKRASTSGWWSNRTDSPSALRASSTPASSKLSRTAAIQKDRPPVATPRLGRRVDIAAARGNARRARGRDRRHRRPRRGTRARCRRPCLDGGGA